MIEFWKNKSVVCATIILASVVMIGIFAGQLSPMKPNQTDINRRLLPPVWDKKGGYLNILGTDQMGRDLLTRIMYGTRISLIVIISSVLVAGAIGTILGLFSGYYGGRLDSLIMRLVDIQLSIPIILLAIVVIAVLGPGLRNLLIVMIIGGWSIYTRVVRGEVLALRERQFVDVAKVSGCGDINILFRQIMPNVLSPIIVISTFQMARMVIFEASLSFLGLGIPPPNPSLGRIIAEGQVYLTNAWWISTIPGLVVVMVVLSANLLGDWLRDRMDPHLRY